MYKVQGTCCTNDRGGQIMTTIFPPSNMGMQQYRMRYIIKFEDGTLLATHSLEDKWVKSKMDAQKHTIIDEDDKNWHDFKDLWRNSDDRQGTLEAFMAADDDDDDDDDDVEDFLRR